MNTIDTKIGGSNCQPAFNSSPFADDPLADDPLARNFRRARGLRQGSTRRGLITWGTLLSVLLLMILVSLVSNAWITVNQKMSTQNTADAVAYSGSVWLVRGMNFVSATNHVIGELNALYTIHHAFGGKWLDDHHSDKKRNSGDWEFTWPPPIGYGGIFYQITNIMLPINYYLAEFLSALAIVGPSPDKDHYDRVSKHPIADIHSAIWEGKENLKNQMNAAYALHIAGASMVIAGELRVIEGTAMLSNPYTFAAGLEEIAAGIQMINNGEKMMKAAKALETAINLEYRMLDLVEDFARNIAPAKLAIPSVIKAMYYYQQVSIYFLFPMNALETADELGQRNHMSAFVLGDVPSISPGSYSGVSDIFTQASQFLPSLPVEAEKVTDEAKSQMIRATNPWVRHWRTKLFLVLTAAAPTSGAGMSFIKWTNKYAYQCSEYLRTPTGEKCKNEATSLNRENKGMDGKGIKMYVLKDLNEQGEKSDEDWNQKGMLGSTRADAIFCVMGYAHSKRPIIKSPAFFRQENPHGMVCYSQAMVYNANPQAEPGATGGDKQPDVGWDTLAWDHQQQRVPEWKDRGDYFWGHMFDIWPDPAPKTKLNWQAKLSPVTTEKIGKTAIVAALYDKVAGEGDIGQVLMNGEGVFSKASHLGEQALLQNH